MYHNIHYLFNILCLYSDCKQRENFLLSKSFTAFLSIDGIRKVNFFCQNPLQPFLVNIRGLTFWRLNKRIYFKNRSMDNNINYLFNTLCKYSGQKKTETFFVKILYSLSVYKFVGSLTFLEIK